MESQNLHEIVRRSRYVWKKDGTGTFEVVAEFSCTRCGVKEETLEGVKKKPCQSLRAGRAEKPAVG